MDFARLFTPRKSGAQKAAMRQAAAEQERARRMAEAANTNPADSEAARSAADARLRRLAAMRGLAGTNRGGGGAAPVGYKTVMGS